LLNNYGVFTNLSIYTDFDIIQIIDLGYAFASNLWMGSSYYDTWFFKTVPYGNSTPRSSAGD
tara:strand:+ start:914 stop:1099 length:186 start_codon:yes stop_codon:yes gene_type:complete